MIIVMKKGAPEEMSENVLKRIEDEKLEGRPVPGRDRMVINVIGDTSLKDHLEISLREMDGVRDIKRIGTPYKLVNRESQPYDTVIDVNGVKIGNGYFTVIAGPCAIENELQAMATAVQVKRAGAHLYRGGAFKPRTSPYAFQGLEERGLEILAMVREKTGLGVVSEAIDHEVFGLVEEYVDIVQIGTRNMHNYSLLKRAGKSAKPILLKRGMSATIEEWLMAAEYIVSEGNPRVILCERGIRTISDHSRNTLDLSAIPFVQKESHLPIIVDPSHACGKRDQVIPLSRAAAGVGCHGLIVEVHNEPDKALCDGAQSLYPKEFASVMQQVGIISSVTGARMRPMLNEDNGRLGILGN